MKKLFLITFIFFGFVATSFGQATASATATATIVTPIGISKVTDMNFGNVIVSSTTTGTVVLTPGSTRTPSGGVTLPPNTGTVAAASFTVSGEDGYTYDITLPSTDYTITRDGGTETMTVNTFTSDPSGTGSLTGGTQTINVGATLNVSAAQASGIYTNSTGFDVTVNYN